MSLRPLGEFDPHMELESSGWERRDKGLYLPSQDIWDEFDAYDEHRLKPFGNSELPVYAHREQIIDAIDNNRIVIIEAETGAGKSTQVPQFIIDHLRDTDAKVFMTQPRRPAALNVGTQIHEETLAGRWENPFCGDPFVGFRTARSHGGALDSRITVETDGLTVARVFSKNHKPNKNDFLIIDELHEFNPNLELLLWYAKHSVEKVVILSATINAGKIAAYLESDTNNIPPVIKIDGRTHGLDIIERPEVTSPDVAIEIIRETFAEAEKNQLETKSPTLQLPNEDKDILIFESGVDEISTCMRQIRSRVPKRFQNMVEIVPLHSNLSVEAQQRALMPIPNTLRVVVSTNIAESSLTPTGMKHIIDGGTEKTLVVDHEGKSTLLLQPISQANANQRGGRAGRTSPGINHRTRPDRKTSFVSHEDRREFPVADFQKTDVSRFLLRVAGYGCPIDEFKPYNEPPEHMKQYSTWKLQVLGALDDELQMTDIGHRMNQYPLGTIMSRVMTEAERYNKEIRSYTAIAAAVHENGGLLKFTRGSEQTWRELVQTTASDHLAQIELFLAAKHMSSSDFRHYNIDRRKYTEITDLYAKLLRTSRTYASPRTLPSSEQQSDILNAITSGYLANMYERIDEGLYEHAHLETASSQYEISRNSVLSEGKQKKDKNADPEAKNRRLERLHKDIAKEGYLDSGSGKKTKAPNLILGDPREIRFMDDGKLIKIDVIENVTIGSTQRIGAVAMTDAIEHRRLDFIHNPKSGKTTERYGWFFHGYSLGMSDEAPAVPSQDLRQDLINLALQRPCATLKQLFQFKDQIEDLLQRQPGSFRPFTQDNLIAILEKAAPSDIIRLDEITTNLRNRFASMNLEEFITRRSGTPLATPDEILNNSPDFITVDETTLQLVYKKGTPIAKHFKIKDIVNLPVDEVKLPDGRTVSYYFQNRKGHTKVYSLEQLRNLFASYID